MRKALAGMPLDFLTLYSSTAAMLGAAGQGNYAAANACLDALACRWRLEGQPAQSVQWGPWAGVGMAARPGVAARLRQGEINGRLGIAALSAVLASPRPGLGHGVVGCALVRWPGFLGQFARAPPRYFATFAQKDEGPLGLPGGRTPPSAPTTPVAGRASLRALVHDSVAAVIGGAVAEDEPLLAAGLDSLSAVELRRRLAERCPGASLPSTLVFDHPTIGAVAAFLERALAPAPPAAAAPPPQPRQGGPQAAAPPATRGLACRFPGGEGPEASWRCWAAQLDSVVEIPLLRFDFFEVFSPDTEALGGVTYARHGGFVEGAELFDPRFFGMSPNESLMVDPQQRQALEVAYAAFHHAGRTKKDLAGSRTGVFAGQCSNDWAKFAAEREAGAFTGPGTHASVTAARISYCLGLQGLSACVDTACSSSLVNVEMALGRLRDGSLPSALCSGTQLNLIAEPFVAFAKGKLLSPCGRCRTFDAAADGFARGEGVGAVYLEAAAGEDAGGLATVAGAAANQDGRSSTLTAPNGPSQQRVLEAALSLAGRTAASVEAVECHGTGTALGDPIEVGALRAVFQGAERATPLVLCALKTNFGHLEGAAGVAGLTKALLALQRHELPPNVHFSRLNPHISLEGFAAEVLTDPRRLGEAPADVGVGVSSFGFGGTNAHAVVTRPPLPQSLPGAAAKECRVAFLFTGHGSQYAGMGAHLYESEGAFRACLDECAALLDPLLPAPLREVLFGSEAARTGLLDQPLFAHPAIFAVGCALAAMWRSKGVRPHAVLGHGVGEYAAAVAAGTLSLADGARLVAARSRLITERCEPGVGSMAALHASEAKVAAAIGRLEEAERAAVAIAAVNGPNLTVVSGRGELVERVLRDCAALSQPLSSPYAFQSPLMAPALDAFREACAAADTRRPVEHGPVLVSALTGGVAAAELQDAGYWVRHITEPVRFADAIVAVAALGTDVFLEVGPKPTLVAMAKSCVAKPLERQWVASLEGTAADRDQPPSDMLAVLRGGLAPLRYRRQAFPWRKPVPRLLRRRVVEGGEALFDAPLSADLLALAAGGALHGCRLVPAALLLEMATEAAHWHVGADTELRDVRVLRPLVLEGASDPEGEPVWLRLAVDPRLRFEARSRGRDGAWVAHLEGRVVRLRPDPGGLAKLKAHITSDLDLLILEATRRYRRVCFPFNAWYLLSLGFHTAPTAPITFGFSRMPSRWAAEPRRGGGLRGRTSAVRQGGGARGALRAAPGGRPGRAPFPPRRPPAALRRWRGLQRAAAAPGVSSHQTTGAGT